MRDIAFRKFVLKICCAISVKEFAESSVKSLQTGRALVLQP